ncbi:MAG: S8 family serine peptidase [Candidatus Sumerlaeia bacterium]|nr:S8 family serine peptidase [Candidatus Sumerlaeia bacterium]
MIRKNAWIVASSLMVAAVAFANGPVQGETPGGTVLQQHAATVSDNREVVTIGNTTLVPSADHTVVQYDMSLTDVQVMARAESDARRLGLEVFKTMAVQNMVVLKGTEAEVTSALEQAEGIPVIRILPSYLRNNDPHPLSTIAFTSRIAVKFAPGTTEAQRRQWLEANGFDRIQESPMGYVILETHRDPDGAMISFTEALEADEEIVAEAIYEFVITGEPTASDSIEVNDPIFPQQWWLADTGNNTAIPELNPDGDIDAPMAWMINQRNIRNRGGNLNDPQVNRRKFGNAVVGLFDSGVEITHGDLSASMDPRSGRDLVDGGLPLPGLSNLGAHGTVMAGLIAASNNEIGMIGVAPGSRIYAVRVFAADYSTSNLRIVTGLQDSVARNIDVNVHPYTLPIDLDCQLSSSIENALRQAWEAGRLSRGLANLAAGGNFTAQVDYPAQSHWTIAVGAVNSSGDRVGFIPGRSVVTHDGNWGGMGIDLVMPSYVPNELGFDSPYSSTIISTDLSGTLGIVTANYVGLRDYSSVVDENRFYEYCPSGFIAGMPYRGSSFATAIAGGVVSLMLSDPRYEDLRPTADPLERATTDDRRAPRTRREYRERATHGEDSILRQLVRHADLPGEDTPASLPASGIRFARGGDLAYIDNYNEFHGFGQPNPAKFLSSPETKVAPDTLHRGLLLEPFYDVDFVQYATLGTEQDEELAPVLRQGWSEIPGLTIDLPLGEGEDADVITVSPYMYGFRSIYFENGEVGIPIATEDGVFFPFAWTDSLPLALESTDQDASETPINLFWNPSGRYQASRVIGLRSPSINVPSERTPMMVNIGMGHQLGVENASDTFAFLALEECDYWSDRQEDFIPVDRDVDTIYIDLVHPNPNEGQPDVVIELAQITGDSRRGYKTRLVPGVPVWDDDYICRMTWPYNYAPWNPTEGIRQGLLVRDYDFFAPALPEGINSFRIEVTLFPGPSYLPSYNTEEEPEQLLSVLRDHLGFIFTHINISSVRPDYMEYRAADTFELTDGFFPTWNVNASKLFLTQRVTPDLPDHSLVVVDPHPNYLVFAEGDSELLDHEPGIFDRANPFSSSKRTYQRYMDSYARVTGMKAHPFLDYLAYTTTSSDGDFVKISTADGINLSPVIPSGQTIGARDPSWSGDGTLLLYASQNYIRLINIDENMNPLNVETIITTASSGFLTDFRSPVVDADGGLIFFTARRTDAGRPHNALQLYAVTRSGRVVSYRESSVEPFLPGWDGPDGNGINIFDLDISQSGRRLIFSANASNAPVPSAFGSSEPTAQATPSQNARLFTIDNFHHVQNNNDPPMYERVEFRGTDATFPKVSGRYARLSPVANEIAWMAYPTTVGPNDISSEGRIIRQPLSTSEHPGDPINEISPTPAPPFAAPGDPIRPDVSIVQLRDEGTFHFDDEGWNFGGAPGALDLPQGRYFREDGRPRVVAPGVIALSSGAKGPIGSQNVLVARLNFRAQNPGWSPMTFETNAPYRTILMDNEYREIPSEFTDGAALILDGVKATKNEPGVPELRLFFPGGDVIDRTATFDVEIRLNGNQGLTEHFEIFLRYDHNLLDFRFGEINTGLFSNQLRGSLELTTAGTSDNLLGYFETSRGELLVEQDSLYLFRAYVRGVSSTNDLGRMPVMRLRANSKNFESAFESITQPTGDDLSLVPSTDRVRPYDLLFRPPAENYDIPYNPPSGGESVPTRENISNLIRGGLFAALPSSHAYTIAFDLFHFSPGVDPQSGFRMKSYKIYRMDDLRLVESETGDRNQQMTVLKNTGEEVVHVPVNKTAHERGDWTFGPAPETSPYNLPEFIPSENGIGLRPTSNLNTFGFWDNSRIDLPISAMEEPTIWINEMARVPNTGAHQRDVAWIEIAGPAGYDISGWTIAGYTEEGLVKAILNDTLSGVIPDQHNGYGTLRYDVEYEPHNEETPPGSAIGISLQDPDGNVAQFISHSQWVEAAEGPAMEMVGDFTGTLTDEAAELGHSVQLAGTGTRYSDFHWKHLSLGSSSGELNSQQEFRYYDIAWINELHHRNEGLDINKRVEVAGVSGTDLAGWRLVYYGPEGNRVGGRNLTGLILSQSRGYGALSFSTPALPSDPGSGVALVRPDGFVVDFVGYGGATQAVGDVANGLVAFEIPAEAEDASAVQSLQLEGFGVRRRDFTWRETPIGRSPGALNPGQHIGAEIYRATFTINNSQEINPTRIPTLRMRFGTRDFQRIAIANALANGPNASTTVPTTNSNRSYEVYLVLESAPPNLTRLFAAYDILSFREDQTVTNQILELEDLKIERLIVPEYPMP